MVIAIGIALAMILPFFFISPEAFIEGVYGHWLYVNIFTVNLSSFVSLLVPWDLMIVIQGIVLLLILIMALRIMDPDDMWGWMAAALVLFIALNRVIEVYFYLLVFLLLVLHGIAVERRQGDVPYLHEEREAMTSLKET
jgi:hypothetical protein